MSDSTSPVSPVKVQVTRTANGKPVAAQQMREVSKTSNKAAEVQGQVEEVINIMQSNIEKVVSRGERLETLQNKTDDLSQGALQFKKSSVQVQNAMWWKDFKLNLIIGGVAATILIVVFVSVFGVPRVGAGASTANAAAPSS